MKKIIKKVLKYIFNVQTRSEYLGTVKPSFWAKVLWFMGRGTRNIAIIASFGVVAVVSAVSWNKLHPVTVYAEREVVKEVKGHAPIMDKIAICESGGKHIDPATGQVLMRSNVNKSVDVGKYQINSVWYKKATELKLDVTKEADNEKMAYWLYENRGTGDWYASKDCWQK